MRFSKNRFRVVTTTAVVLLLTAGGWLAFKPSPKITTTSTPITSQTTKAADPTQSVIIETADFKYAKPAGWAEISKNTLSSSGASSGIGRPIEPVATFTVKVSSVTPSGAAEIKNAVLDGPKKLPNFVLISTADTKIDGQPGQMFVYSFTGSTGQDRSTQQMNIIIYKQRSFFLAFQSTSANYDKQTSDFASILASFKFK